MAKDDLTRLDDYGGRLKMTGIVICAKNSPLRKSLLRIENRLVKAGWRKRIFFCAGKDDNKVIQQAMKE